MFKARRSRNKQFTFFTQNFFRRLPRLLLYKTYRVSREIRAETRVKVRELSLEWFPTSTMALTLVQQLVISCDFTDLRTLRVKNDNIIMWERTKD